MESLLDHYPPADAEARRGLHRRLRNHSLGYGTWNQVKGLYKRLEADPEADPETLGLAIARLDSAVLGVPHTPPTIPLAPFTRLTGFTIREDRIAIVGNVGYSRSCLVTGVVDPQNPLKPDVSPPVDVPRAQSVALVGDVVCVFQPRLTLSLFTAGDPQNPPVPRGTLRLESGIEAMLEADGHLVVLTGADRGKVPSLLVVDVAVPDSPSVIGSLEIAGASRLALLPDQRHLLVLCAATGFRWGALPSPGSLHVVDLSDPSRPRVVRRLGVAGSAIAVEGNLAVVAGGADGLQRVDCTDPMHPTVESSTPCQRDIVQVALRGNTAYAAPPYGNAWVVDTLGATAPRQTIVLSGVLAGLHLAGTNLFAGAAWQGIGVWDVTRPEAPHALGNPPSDRTLGYMKRRARRFLKRLAITAPQRYVEIAAAVLSEEKGDALNWRSSWVAHDILHGASRRFEHGNHGRSGILEKIERRPPVRSREARAIDIWDAQPHHAARIYRLAQVPWQCAEFALQTLRATGSEIPALPITTARKHLDAPSPLLRAFAVRAMAALDDLPAEVAARVLVRASRNVRESFAPKVVAALADPAWADAFLAALIPVIGDTEAPHRIADTPAEAAPPRFTRRQVAAARFLATHLRDRVTADLLLVIAPLLLASGEPDFVALVESAARTVPVDDLEEWVSMLGEAPTGPARERVLQALETAVKDKSIEYWIVWELVDHENPFVREAIWRLLAASATPRDELREIFDDLVFDVADASSIGVATRGAFASAFALTLLERAGIDVPELARRLAERPFLIDAITPEAFRTLVQRAPVSLVLALIDAASDTQWSRLRRGWLDNLREGVGVAAAWEALARAIPDDDSGRLAARTIDDPEVADALLGTDAIDTVLEVRRPELGALLARFLERHRDAILDDIPRLLCAATHPLPELRTPALEAVRRRGEISLAFALRLLECEIPASVAVGAAWFDATPPGDPQEMRHVLALCDSPVTSVREAGRAAIARRRETLDRDVLCTALFENADPQMQACAAALASDEEIPAATPRFDAELLRTRHRSRRAREVVKRRQERAPTVDTETLLALARSQGTPRDADWALEQLVRRALAGETIAGLDLP